MQQVTWMEKVVEYFHEDGRECNDCPFARKYHEPDEFGGQWLNECSIIEGDDKGDCPGVAE